MLTHKIRDMPQHMFEKPPIKPDESPVQPHESHPEPEKPNPPPPEPPCDQLPKRAPTEIDMPLPKRPPSKYFYY